MHKHAQINTVMENHIETQTNVVRILMTFANNIYKVKNLICFSQTATYTITFYNEKMINQEGFNTKIIVLINCVKNKEGINIEWL